MDSEQVTADVHEALAAAIYRHERSMLGKWVVVAETTDEDGNRGVWTVRSAENLPYETLGLLHHALTNDDSAEDEDC